MQAEAEAQAQAEAEAQQAAEQQPKKAFGKAKPVVNTKEANEAAALAAAAE